MLPMPIQDFPVVLEIKDPIHGYVGLSELEQKIVDLRLSQRLRYIRSPAGIHLVFPGADSSLMGRMLGVMYVTEVFVESLDGSLEEVEKAADRAAERRMLLALAPERYRVAGLKLRPRTVLSGTCGAVQAENAEGIILHDISFDGGILDTGNAALALVSLKNCADISICRIDLKASGGRGCRSIPAAPCGQSC